MSKGVNKVIIIGNLGNDPDVKYMPNGTCVASLSVATSEKWKDKNTGQEQTKTEWHRIKIFGKLGEITGQYLKKGSKAYFEGSLRTNKWTDKDSIERYTTEIIANQMQMLDGKNSTGEQEHSSTTGTQVDNSSDSFDDGIPWDDKEF